MTTPCCQTSRTSSAFAAVLRHPMQVRTGELTAPSLAREVQACSDASNPPRPPEDAQPRPALAWSGQARAGAGSVSDRMSIRHPVSRAASRAFWPSRPMARESW